jgi:hypothetical protein
VCNILLGLTVPSIRALPQAQVGFASRDHEVAVEVLAVLPTEHNALLEQQTTGRTSDASQRTWVISLRLLQGSR